MNETMKQTDRLIHTCARLETIVKNQRLENDRIKTAIFSLTLSAANNRHHSFNCIDPQLYTAANARWEILRLLIEELELMDEYMEYLRQESRDTAIFDPVFKEAEA